VVERLGERWPQAEREAAVWKRCADAAAHGHLLVDLTSVSLTKLTPLICLDASNPPILPDPLPSALSESMTVLEDMVEQESNKEVHLLATFDDSTLQAHVRERFLRNLRAVEAVLSGTTAVEAAREHQVARSTLSRLVQRTRKHGVLACVPHGTSHRERDLHPAFQEIIRRLYLLPTKLSMTAIAEHADLRRVAKRLQEDTGTVIPLPTYEQIRGYVDVLKQNPQVHRSREQVKGSLRDRQSPHSFALSLPAPAQLAQVDEHSMDLYVITPDGIPVTRRVHAAVLICVKTAAIMSAVLSLGPLSEEDYMRLVKMALEPKDRLVLQAGCQHPWPCSGKPAIIFHDRGKIFHL
jgi:transposase